MSSREHDAFTRNHLARTLPDVAPHLFSLTDTIIEASDTDPFDLIIGDDTNCRLPVYFIRRALARTRGEHPRTMFVNGSRIMREELPPSAYVGYIAHHAADAGRVLIVSEIVGSGSAMTGLKSVTRDALPDADIRTAAVASKWHVPELLDYVGSEGIVATTAIFRSFEGVARGSLQTRFLAGVRRAIPQVVKDHTPERYKAIGQPYKTGGAVTGLYTPRNADYPVSKPDRTHSLGVAYASMDGLLEQYLEEHRLVDSDSSPLL